MLVTLPDNFFAIRLKGDGLISGCAFTETKSCKAVSAQLSRLIVEQLATRATRDGWRDHPAFRDCLDCVCCHFTSKGFAVDQMVKVKTKSA
jgi:hypothetical protein